MIPSEVSELADLLAPEGWRETSFEEDILEAAWRIYNAGFRKDLLEEQNALLREQNKLLTEANACASGDSFRASVNAAADRWDRDNPVARLFFKNPIQRR